MKRILLDVIIYKMINFDIIFTGLNSVWIAKFIGLSAALLSGDRQKEIKDMIFACEKISTKDFMAKLVA